MVRRNLDLSGYSADLTDQEAEEIEACSQLLVIEESKKEAKKEEEKRVSVTDFRDVPAIKMKKVEQELACVIKNSEEERRLFALIVKRLEDSQAMMEKRVRLERCVEGAKKLYEDSVAAGERNRLVINR